MLKRIFFMILISLVLCSACGSGGSGSGGRFDNNAKTIEISSDSSDVTIDESNINVFVSGDMNKIHITEGIYVYQILITGDMNKILIDPNVIIDDFICDGDMNKIWIPLDSGITVQGQGDMTNIIEYE